VTRLIQVWSKRCPKFPIPNDLGGRFLSPLIFLSLSLSLSHMLIFFPSPPARRPHPSSRAGLSLSLSGRRVRAASPLRRGSVRCAGITRTTTHASCWGRKPHPLAELGTRNPIIPPPTADARPRGGGGKLHLRRGDPHQRHFLGRDGRLTQVSLQHHAQIRFDFPMEDRIRIGEGIHSNCSRIRSMVEIDPGCFAAT
jgi:hypothetical protein